jgi:hypothetical protein
MYDVSYLAPSASNAIDEKMSGVSVLQHFEVYQKSRARVTSRLRVVFTSCLQVAFVQAVAEAATRPQNIEVMQNAGVMQLLRPLLLDNVSRWLKFAQYIMILGPQYSAISSTGAWSPSKLQ